jgi:hypothetical protein
VHEADVQRALNFRIVYDEPIAALLFPIGVELEVVEEVVRSYPIGKLCILGTR